LQHADNRLATGKIYKLATSSERSWEPYRFVWTNHAPPKVKFFAWLLVQNRIQCSSNLKKKNILEHDTCTLCSLSAENADHLITGCPFAQCFWRYIGWDPTLIPPATDLWQLKAQAGAPQHSLNTMFLLYCWQLWNHSHDVVFHDSPPSLHRLLAACREAADLWRYRLPNALRCDVDYWSHKFAM
jgi:hypothetical protein